MMGIMTITEVSIDMACSAYPTMWVNIFRLAAYYGMTKEGLQRGVNVVRQDNVEKQYNEVADELQKLQNIICTVADFQEQQEAEKFKREMEMQFNKDYSYSVSEELREKEKEKKKSQKAWWWPFDNPSWYPTPNSFSYQIYK